MSKGEKDWVKGVILQQIGGVHPSSERNLLQSKKRRKFKVLSMRDRSTLGFQARGCGVILAVANKSGLNWG